ncbi:MAG: AAA family ATPase [Egibacteraceae bacterium]
MALILDVLLILLAVAGLAAEYLSPKAAALPLLGIMVLLIGARVWLYMMERAASPKRVWTATRPPYPGLEAFTEQDAGVFFGREAESKQLFARLHPILPEQAHRFVAVIGPSGAGKSSLVQAGLLPRLAQQRSRWVVVPPLVPGTQPTNSLARSLAAALPGTQVDALAAELAGDPGALVRCVEQLRTAAGGRTVLLVVDQAEELVTRAGEQERAGFLALLRAALGKDRGLWVVATLRSEFLTGFLTSGFSDLFRNPVVIGALDRAALFQAIEGPAAQADLTFTFGVVNALVDDTGGGDALPLLAYTLRELYLRVGSGGTVTAEDYRRLGGVAGALSQQADKVTVELQAADVSAPVLATLLKFVAIDEAEPTRRRVRRSTLTDAECGVVDAFVAARLLTSDAEGDDAVIEVAHEALFRQWPPLRQEIKARADELRQRAELERWAQDWVRSGCKDSYLLRDERLESAEQRAAAHGDLRVELPLVHEFLVRSARSDRAALKRLSESVARRALGSVDHDPELGVLLALAAIEECAATPLAQRALLTALTVSRVRGIAHGHEDWIRSVAWSPDGRRIATASADRTARVWDAETGAQLTALRGHEDWVVGVGWSPDGQRIATVSRDRTVRVWDAEAGTELAVLRGHDDGVEWVAWSPDGRRIATASYDRTVRIWNAEADIALAVLRGHEDWVGGVAWSPDGRRIATASGDRTARVWDVESGIELAVLRGHEDWVRGVGWPPDGRRIVTASGDRTARVWDVESGAPLAVLRGHDDMVEGVAWAPDGRRIVTASSDRTVRVWDVESGVELMVLRGHQNGVEWVAWSPDIRQIATASRDRTARVWDVESGVELTVLRGHEDWILGVGWAPDGQRIVTASRDRTARVWDVESSAPLALLRGHEDWVAAVAWSPESRRIATASGDRTARVWDVESSAPLTVLRGHQDRVLDVGWSPDGRRIVTASRDRTARVWDVESGAPLMVLRGHEDWVVGVGWSPDGRRIVTASGDRTARVWDVESSAPLTVLRGHEDWVFGVGWSPDGQRIVTASGDRTVRVWDVESSAPLMVLRGHEDGVGAVAWSPDGRRIVTASGDRTVRVWDASHGAELAVVGVHEHWIEGVAWSPDARCIATASRDRTARVWNAETDLHQLVAKARTRVFRELTDDERRSAMLPDLTRPV